MITDFEDFCLYVYVIVDDLYQQLKPLVSRPGPAPRCSDSELLALCLIGECKGWDIETDMLSNMRAYPGLFPHLPEQSRLNRRRRGLMWVMNILRRLLLSHLDLAQDGQCIIDSLPIEVVHFHLVPSCRGDWGAYGATFGKVTTKKQTNRIHLHTLPRRNQKSQLPACVKYLLSAARQLIETVNSQLTEQFNIESSHAHSF